MVHIIIPKSPIWVFSEGLGMEIFGIWYGHLEHIMATLYILWLLSNSEVIWKIFPLFWYIVPRKIWQPWFCYSNNRIVVGLIRIDHTSAGLAFRCVVSSSSSLLRLIFFPLNTWTFRYHPHFSIYGNYSDERRRVQR
jgi:hypothetical protein